MDQPSLPLVTIAVPTYNRANTYLRSCLESALRQTYKNIEIIVSDNGSTDGTEALVRRYADPRLRYFKQSTNIVPNENFNFCLRQARGAYFLLLLDDEQIDLDFVETCMRAAEFRPDYGLIRTGVRTIDARGNLISECPNLAGGLDLAGFFLAWFAGHTSLYLCNTLFHRETLLEVGGFGSRHNLFQDVIALVRVAARRARADSPAVKATTRLHGSQYTYSATVRAWCEDSLDLLDLMCRVAPGGEEMLRKRGSRFFAMIGYSRANSIRAAIARLRAYAVVYQIFGRRYLPPVRMLLVSTSTYRSLRQVKRRLLGMPAWVD
jgi:lambda repressor-like predicted transcriptional regulator